VFALEALTLGLAPDAVRLGFLDAGGMALDADPHRQAQLETFFVGQAELACQLVHPDLLGQVAR
jgi:hypothetical protein